MKKIMVCAVIISALVLLASCATLDPESSFEIQQTVVEVEGASSDELFVRANGWMTQAFNSAKAVIQYSDKDAGIIRAKYDSEFYIAWADCQCTTDLLIECKDGKARLTIEAPYDFKSWTTYGYSKVGNLTSGAKESLQLERDSLVASFNAFMVEKSESNW